MFIEISNANGTNRSIININHIVKIYDRNDGSCDITLVDGECQRY